MARDTSGPKNEPQYSGTGASADAADLTEVGAYAATVGNRKLGPTTARNTAAGADVWEGLLWGDTTDKTDYRYTSGAWVRMIDVLDTGWQTPSLGSGWTSQSLETIQYRRKNGVVVFRGRAIPAAGAATNLFTLPTGYLPDGYANNVFMAEQGSGVIPARIIVQSSGAVAPSAFTTGALIALSQVTFLAI